jgi:pyridoxal phosphate-dependent aminotransferase EpsN
VEACAEYGVDLIEDAAEALGTLYFSTNPEAVEAPGAIVGDVAVPAGRRAITPGTLGRTGIYSFNGNKIITTSGGGMLVSADPAVVEQARFLATQARDPAPHYEHTQAGFNYRLSNVLAGIGRGQLAVLADRVAARRRNFDHYETTLGDLPGIGFMPEPTYGRSSRWLSCITVDPAQSGGVDRERVREALAAEDIEARPVWKPMHLQPLYEGAEYLGQGVSDRLFDHGLCLPSGSNLEQDQLDRVSALIRQVWTG